MGKQKLQYRTSGNLGSAPFPSSLGMLLWALSGLFELQQQQHLQALYGR